MTSFERLQKALSQKAKTIKELEKDLEQWRKLFSQGAGGNQEAYAKARDMRPRFEEDKWIRLEDHEELFSAFQRTFFVSSKEPSLRKQFDSQIKEFVSKERWINSEQQIGAWKRDELRNGIMKVFDEYQAGQVAQDEKRKAKEQALSELWKNRPDLLKEPYVDSERSEAETFVWFINDISKWAEAVEKVFDETFPSSKETKT